MSQKDTTNTIHEDETPQDVPVESAEPQAAEADASSTTAGAKPEALAALEQKAKEYMDGWMRERADFANYKKRVENQLRDSAQNAAVEALVTLLPVIDDFERAMSNVPPELAGNPWLNGVSMIQRKLQKMLDDQGVTVLDPVGDVFDPSRHEAVGTEDSSEVESGHVAVTLQKGYLHGDRVLRPALVKVAN
ncbi:MAG: nucleotide exchange factor GrpE [Anaerolineae bacterium]|nr:nucleotide exchange factor GrpE [Anaerolineae bacterium]